MIFNPPVSYFGGKQSMARHIVPIVNAIPHKVYCEPFCGGAAIYWRKGLPRITNNQEYREILNDTNGLVTNFFDVIRSPKLIKRLIEKLELTPYSRETNRLALDYCRGRRKTKSKVKLAWAFWTNIESSFINGVGKGWGMSIDTTCHPSEFYLKVQRIKGDAMKIVERMRFTYIENCDALALIKRADTKDTLFYLDPPYINTAQGHYGGYTPEDYTNLIELLKIIKGSFVLSGYNNNEIVPKEWQRMDFDHHAGSSGGRNGAGGGKRVESIWVVDRSEGRLESSGQLLIR